MWLLIAILVLISIWFYFRFKRMSILSRNGIPGNRPHLIFGNLFDLKNVRPIDKQNRLIERYGKIVAFYYGANPQVLVADPQLSKNILIKDFDNFPDRTNFFKYLHPSSLGDGSIFSVKRQRWEKIRRLLSPAFSASKLKTMTQNMDDSINTFIEILAKNSESDKEINICELFQRLSVEIIIKSAFGVKIEAQNDPNNEYIQSVHKYLESKPNKIVLLMSVCFPEIYPIIQFIRAQHELLCYWLRLHPISFIWRMSSYIIHLRKQNTDLHQNDILQVMIDSSVTDGQISAKDERMTAVLGEKEEVCDKINGNNVKRLKINKSSAIFTENDIIANSISFLTAGYETSSTVLSYVTHILVNNPDIQERVRQEVFDLYESEGKLDYNTVSKLQYMECVLNETMRINPPVINSTARMCLQDYKFKNITIPKGTTVVMCTHFLHHDPDYWDEPDKFDPMRFSSENKHKINGCSWQPFGDGPRNCMGIRFAYLTMKLTLANLLLHYKLEAGPNTEMGKLVTKFKLVTLAPKNGVYVRFRKI